MSELYLVTGGCGFIGSHIVDELERRGKRVRVLDILDGGDIRCSLHEIMQGVDYVLHQAAIPGVGQSLLKPLATNSVNVEGTLNLLEAATVYGVKRFVYASSSSVYGDTVIAHKRESMFPNPCSPYAASKYAGELYCDVYRKVYGLPTVSLRYFNVFGPRQQLNAKHTAVVPCFLDAALNGEPVAVEGHGDQSRDFTYVQNVVDANLLACHSDEASGAFNIGCGEITSINELVGIVEGITGKRLTVDRRVARVGDVLYSTADISKARRVMGYEPKVKLVEGLRLTWEWMQNR
jgi:UDP-glucose 4-epimerase